jgi:hypothetical protein
MDAKVNPEQVLPELQAVRDEYQSQVLSLSTQVLTLQEECNSLMVRALLMQEALQAVKLRAAFIGWPAESFWDAGHGKMIPDWRKELQQIESALTLEPIESLKTMEEWQRKAKLWDGFVKQVEGWKAKKNADV